MEYEPIASKQPRAEVDTRPDEHAGAGGEYILDPVTGRRRLVARTKPPEAVAPAGTAQASEPEGSSSADE